MKKLYYIIMIFLFFGCPVQYSRVYKPSDPLEKEAFNNSERKVFPEDVRKTPAKYKETLVAWTGILKKADVISSDPEKRTTVKFTIEHHYWDWVEDHSIQKAVAFLSPRGEGNFSCIKTSSEADPEIPSIESMAIVYGYPMKVTQNEGVIELNCTGISFAAPSWYSTEIWDYGRDYILKGDKSDFKVLKVPLR